MPKLISEATFRDIEKMLAEGGLTNIEIAAKAGVEQSLVSTIANGRHNYQRDLAAKGLPPKYIPTPAQIETECARLRAARKPADDQPDGWPPPSINVAHHGRRYAVP